MAFGARPFGRYIDTGCNSFEKSRDEGLDLDLGAGLYNTRNMNALDHGAGRCGGRRDRLAVMREERGKNRNVR